MKIDWQLKLKQLKRNYKPLKCIAHEVGGNPKTFQVWARRGVKVMPYEIGVEILSLHMLYCGKD